MNEIFPLVCGPKMSGGRCWRQFWRTGFIFSRISEWKPLVAAWVQDLLDGFGPSAQPGYEDDLKGLMAAASTGAFKMR